MAVSTTPLQPRSASSSSVRLLPFFSIIDLTENQPFLWSGETVGLAMPGVTLHARSSTSSGASYSTIMYFIATMRPSMRRTSLAIAGSSFFAGLAKSAALERKSGSPRIFSPAMRSVVPVSTMSTTASATPSATEISTAPSSTTSLRSSRLKNLFTMFGKEVAMRSFGIASQDSSAPAGIAAQSRLAP